MSRVLIAYVSKYQRNRVHIARLIRGDYGSLTVNANGCLAAGAEIESITWQVQDPSIAILGEATVGARTASVRCTAGNGGWTIVKATITADNGDVFTQLFDVRVSASPYFDGETPPAAGPSAVTAP